MEEDLCGICSSQNSPPNLVVLGACGHRVHRTCFVERESRVGEDGMSCAECGVRECGNVAVYFGRRKTPPIEAERREKFRAGAAKYLVKAMSDGRMDMGTALTCASYCDDVLRAMEEGRSGILIGHARFEEGRSFAETEFATYRLRRELSRALTTGAFACDERAAVHLNGRHAVFRRNTIILVTDDCNDFNLSDLATGTAPFCVGLFSTPLAKSLSAALDTHVFRLCN